MSTSYDLLSSVSSTIAHGGGHVAGTEQIGSSSESPSHFPMRGAFLLFGSIKPHHFLHL